MTQNPESTQFGTQTVTPQEKTARVHGVFDSVASNYDIMNDLMSGGLHRLWKDRFVRIIRPKPHHRILDVAGGTGDIAFRLHKTKNRPPTTDHRPPITICDLTPAMLQTGRDRAIDKGWLNGFDWITGNAEALPFPDNHFDLYTIAFGLRNVTRIDQALTEAHRVLKPGGRFFCLEFSHVRNPILAKAYDVYSYAAIPKIGKIVAKDEDSYQYLVESIRKFPKQKQLANRLKAAGFATASYENMTGGIVAIHQALKT
ncbi:MAG: bifunctional demethylmenaquinone methyltransferase/2-methoxy-6-polyprenyl-1,4-benzoquinol methylase UbiE [Bdellovibrionales bacterium]